MADIIWFFFVVVIIAGVAWWWWRILVWVWKKTGPSPLRRALARLRHERMFQWLVWYALGVISGLLASGI